jgi:hypothetical protein
MRLVAQPDLKELARFSNYQTNVKAAPYGH